MTSLCVYCGSNFGSSPEFAAKARKLGTAMANRGITLVYGGGSVGLMGVAADAAMDAGGEVVGVITEQLMNAEVAHRALTRLEVVPSMHERKARLEELADGFIVLPGGFGTVDEFAEILTWNQLGIVAKPIVLLDIEQFWSPLLQWMDNAVQAGFVRSAHRMLAQRARTVDEAIALATSPAPITPHKWLDRDATPIGAPRP
ncbi:MAG: TIGR00730 family Rossman fold protein [Actinomycetota bacterium]|nr:TIGR00730 family Rossman fold protein [Actinomycetota bacterium]